MSKRLDKPTKAAIGQARTGRPRKGTASLVTVRILDAASDLFLRNGFAETSTDMVAASANCSKRTLYVRFPSKSDLFRAVVLRFASERLEIVKVATGLRNTLRERLYAAAEKIVEASLSKQSVALLRLLHAEAHKFPELTEIVEREAREPHLDLVMRLLANEPAISARHEDLHFLAEQFLVLTTTSPMRQAIRSAHLLNFSDDMRAYLYKSVDFFLLGTGLREEHCEAKSNKQAMI